MGILFYLLSLTLALLMSPNCFTPHNTLHVLLAPLLSQLKTKQKHSSGNLKIMWKTPHHPPLPPLRPPTTPVGCHVTRLSSGGVGRDTSPLSGPLAGAQCSDEGLDQGRAAIQTKLLCFVFFALPLLRPGLLIISISNGLFKIGYVKVRDSWHKSHWQLSSPSWTCDFIGINWGTDRCTAISLVLYLIPIGASSCEGNAI